MLRAPCQAIAATLLGVSSFRSACLAQPALLLVPQHLRSSVDPSSSSSSSSRRAFAGGVEDHNAEVDTINEKFAEAREEIEYAREDAETVYFNESAEVARTAVAEVLDRWQALLGKVSADEQAKLQRSMGLKIEQLKAELKELEELHA